MPLHDARFGQLQCCDCADSNRVHALRARQQRLLTALASELGPRLASATFDTFDTDRRVDDTVTFGRATLQAAQQRQSLVQALARTRAWAERPVGWLALLGPTGTGKSHLAAAAATSLAAHGMAVTYASTPMLFSFVRAGLRDYSADARLMALADAPVLVLDDLGAEATNDLTAEWLYKLINSRLLHERPTIISSNMLLSSLDLRIADRIEDISQIVYVIASSYRRERRRARDADGPRGEGTSLTRLAAEPQ